MPDLKQISDISIPKLDFREDSLRRSLKQGSEDLEEEADKFSEEEYDLLTSLIRRMMQYKPEQRLTAEEAIDDPFFFSSSQLGSRSPTAHARDRSKCAGESLLFIITKLQKSEN